MLARTDESGVNIGAELTRIGYAGGAPPGARPVAAYFEAHIEQGPVLEAENKIIGVVTGGQGKRSYEVTVSGQEAHAGTTPMAVRRDALQGAVRMIAEADRIALDNAPQAVATVGMVSVKPNSRKHDPRYCVLLGRYAPSRPGDSGRHGRGISQHLRGHRPILGPWR